jgi:fibronectin type 3 domain-containing protein
MKKLIPVLVIFTLVFLSGCGMLLDNLAGEEFDESRLERGSNVPGKVGEISYFFTPEGIFLVWEPVSGAVGYYVYRSSTGPTGEYTELTTDGITESDYLDDIVTIGTYHYKIAAYNYTEEGTQSDVVSVSWPGGAAVIASAPAEVTNVTAVSGSTGIKIDWNTVSGADRYHIYRSTSRTGNYDYLKSSASSSCVDTTGESGTYYYYKVAAVSSGKFVGAMSDSTSGVWR